MWRDGQISARTALGKGAKPDVLQRGRRRPGAPLLADLLHDRAATTVTRLQAEERFLELIRLAELPVPHTNVRAHGFELDFVFSQQRVVVEVDGYRFHSSRSAFERDRRKDAILSAAGWHVLRVTWRQMEREPLAVIAARPGAHKSTNVSRTRRRPRPTPTARAACGAAAAHQPSRPSPADREQQRNDEPNRREQQPKRARAGLCAAARLRSSSRS